jgi:polyisoprenoid-binding protein YceI
MPSFSSASTLEAVDATAGLRGTYQLGPHSGRLLVKTGRAGLGMKAGHDLLIEVTRWTGTATVDTADLAGSRVRVEIDANSFELREEIGGLIPLSAADHAEIKRNIREKVLDTVRYPTITFQSTRITRSARSFTAEGDLTIAGVTRSVTVEADIAGDRAHGTATIVQSRWGIKPYSALLGALKVKDEVEIELEVNMASAGSRGPSGASGSSPTGVPTQVRPPTGD